MNSLPPLTADDPRLLALALGEIRDPAERAALEAAVAADPRLAAGYEQARAFAGELRLELAREPIPFVDSAAVAARAMGATPATARRRATGGLGGSLAGTRSSERDATRTRFVVYGGLGLATAACLALALVPQGADTSAPKRFANETVEKPAGMVVSANRIVGLASLAAALPSLSGAGENFSTAARAPLALAAVDANPYLAAFTRELEAGRRPAPDRIRVDGLVNAFIAARPVAPGSRPVTLETSLTEAPWDASHRLLRVTVRAQGVSGAVVAKNASASVEFDPARVKSWRVLGYAGGVRAPESVVLHGGDTVTTLYEIEVKGNASGKLADIGVRYARADRPAAESASVSLNSGDCRSFAATDEDTRFAAGLAAYALNLGENPVGHLARCAGENPARRAFAALAR